MVPEIVEQACVLCNEAITNPLCPNCLEKEMKDWLADHEYVIRGGLEKTTQLLPKPDVTNMCCIICGSRMDVCPHCYCKEVVGDLVNLNSALVGKFVKSFNFELTQNDSTN